MRQIYIHLHIPKCGGSSVAVFLRNNFGRGLYSTNGILNDYQYSADQVSRIFSNFPNLVCLTGHKLSLDLPYSDPRLELRVMTWIRDPIERFISHYFYHRNHTTLVPEAKTLDLLDYAEWALEKSNQKMYINGQTRFLAGGSDDLGLEKILGRVSEGRLTLFPLDRLEETFSTLKSWYPEDFCDASAEARNTSVKDQSVSDDLRSIVAQYSEFDMELLELARKTPLVEEPQCRSGVVGTTFGNRVVQFSARALRALAVRLEARCSRN